MGRSPTRPACCIRHRPPALVRGHLQHQQAMGHPISVGPGSLQQHPPAPLLAPGRQRGLPVLPGPGRRGEGAHLAIEAARRAGRRLVMGVTTKDQHEQTYWAEQVEPLLGDDIEVRASATRPRRRRCWPGRRGVVPDPVARAVQAGDDRGHGLWDPGDAWRNGSVPEVTLTGRPALSSTRSRRWRPPSTGSANSTPT